MVTFDFTDERIFMINDERTIHYKKLNTKQRKNYIVDDKPYDGKIAVEITNVEDQVYKCIYKYRTAEDIYNMIVNDYPLNLKGTYVKDFDITKIENHTQYMLKDFDASYSFLDGYLNFNIANFCDGDIRFDSTNFGKGNVSFSQVNFGEGYISFSNANFGKGHISFFKTKFAKGDVSFVGTDFGEGDISFREAKFAKGDIIFIFSNFGRGDVSFDYAQFGEGYVSFIKAKFGKGDVSFNFSNFGEGEVSFISANFGEGNVNFYGANLSEKNISFQDVKVGNVIFRNNIWSNHIDLRFKKVNGLILQNCIIEKTIKLNGADYEKLSFVDSVNLGQIYIDWDKNNVLKAIVDGNVEFSEKSEKKKRKHTNEELASQFRMLKENFHNIGYYDDEDKAYYAYMFYKRKVLEETAKNEETKETIKYRGVKRAFYWLFEKVGGYGTKPHTILFWMLGTVLAFGGLQAFFINSDKGFWMGLLKSMYFSVITFLTIGYGDIHPVGAVSALLAGIEGFLGLFLMSYFTVTIVRKLLR